jgi:hypothetical protein
VANLTRANVFQVASNPPAADETRRQEIANQFVERRNVFINIYGQFVDQNNNVIPGVSIKISIRHLTTPNPLVPEVGSKEIYLEKISDSEGRFEFSNEVGDGIDIESIRKDGYQLSPKTPNHFGPSSGSFQNPVLVKMWKETAKESLIGGSYVFGIDSGKIYTLNLTAGKKIEGETEGDLRVLITRPNGVGPRDKFPWSLSLEAIQGGFAEPDASDEFMNIAPEAGYEPKIEMQFDPNDPAWVGIVRKQFFIRSRNGQVYGRAKVEIDSIYNVHSAIQINYTINPNASRNLQP